MFAMARLKHTVLVVDDDADVVASLRDFLEPDFRVLGAGRASEALDLLARNTVHVVMSDNQMPEMNGVDFLERVREQYPEAVRLVATGSADPRIAIEAINRGHVFHYFVKPWKADELLLVIRKAVEGYELFAERRRLVGELREKQSELAAANRAKDDFLARLSHELRSPLTPIVGWVKLVRSGRLDAKTVAKALGTIEQSAKALQRMIEDLLDVSRVTAGKLRLDLRLIDLGAVLGAAVESLRFAAEAKRLTVEFSIDPATPRVAGDADRLQQVFWNLLSNAIKFTAAGGRVAVRAERAGFGARVAVRDNGRGIRREFLPYVFDDFRQQEAPAPGAKSGLGLGLAIVRHLVELHGATVRADSAGEGEGACFTVEFPAPVPRVAAVPAAPPEAAEEPSIDAPMGQILSGLRILTVEDDDATREFLATVLVQSGAETTTAGSVREALAALGTGPFDLLISDIAMPGEDGYTLIGKVRLRETSGGGRMPALALTGQARAEDRVRLLRAGFQAHLPKPIDPRELALVAASLVGR